MDSSGSACAFTHEFRSEFLVSLSRDLMRLLWKHQLKPFDDEQRQATCTRRWSDLWWRNGTFWCDHLCHPNERICETVARWHSALSTVRWERNYCRQVGRAWASISVSQILLHFSRFSCVDATLSRWIIDSRTWAIFLNFSRRIALQEFSSIYRYSQSDAVLEMACA